MLIRLLRPLRCLNRNEKHSRADELGGQLFCEDAVQPDDGQEVADLGLKMSELQDTSRGMHGVEDRGQFADASRVDLGDARQVDEDVSGAVIDQGLYLPAQVAADRRAKRAGDLND
jgi:hypothetical protein